MDERGAEPGAEPGYEVERVYLALALRGPALDPAQVTRMLALRPTIAASAEESVAPREGF
jgi:hypothetical protein